METVDRERERATLNTYAFKKKCERKFQGNWRREKDLVNYTSASIYIVLNTWTLGSLCITSDHIYTTCTCTSTKVPLSHTLLYMISTPNLHNINIPLSHTPLHPQSHSISTHITPSRALPFSSHSCSYQLIASVLVQS